MTSSIPRLTTEQRTQYLRDMLALNPLRQAEEIIQQRTRTWLVPAAAGDSNPAERSVGDLEEARRKGAAQIAEIRQNFWQTELNTLHRQLKGLKVEQFPDLRHAASRLWIVAKHRDVFPRLAADPDFDGPFFRSFREVLVCSPREATELRERVRATLQTTVRVKRVRRMLRLLRESVPEVWTLEETWLESLCRAPGRRGGPSSSGDRSWFGLNISLNGWGWVVWVVLFLGLRLLMLLARS